MSKIRYIEGPNGQQIPVAVEKSNDKKLLKTIKKQQVEIAKLKGSVFEARNEAVKATMAAAPREAAPAAPPPPPKPLTRREELRILKANPRTTQWDVAVFCNQHGDELMAEVDAERRNGGSAA